MARRGCRVSPDFWGSISEFRHLVFCPSQGGEIFWRLEIQEIVHRPSGSKLDQVAMYC